MESCTKHPNELGVGLCQRCGMAWCQECLVYAFGPKKPPYCVECAMFAGGVRSAAPRPAMSRRDLKARLKAAKVAAKAALAPAPAEADLAGEGAAFAAAPPLPVSDWERPWWEDRPAGDREPTLAD